MATDPSHRRLAPWINGMGAADPSEKDGALLCHDAIGAGVAGIILESAKRHAVTLPRSCVTRLQAVATAVAACNLHMLHELDRVVMALHDASIDVMLLKGAALQRTLYSRLDLRPMSDLDLMVRPAQALEAVQVLLNHGCRRGCPLIREDFFPTYHYELELATDSTRSVRIDLHARPFRPLRISRTMPDDAIWSGATKILSSPLQEVWHRFSTGVFTAYKAVPHAQEGLVQRPASGETKAFVPRSEFMFMHLAGHAAFHGCRRLLWLYDIKRFAEAHGSTLDWALIADSCREWRLTLPVRRAIDRTEELFGPICPIRFREELARQDENWRDRLALAHAPRDAGSPIAHVAVNILCTPGIAFRLGYLFAHLVPGKNHLAGLYPYRHAGWPIVATMWRVLRSGLRGVGLAVWPIRAIGRFLHHLMRPAVNA